MKRDRLSQVRGGCEKLWGSGVVTEGTPAGDERLVLLERCWGTCWSMVIHAGRYWVLMTNSCFGI